MALNQGLMATLAPRRVDEFQADNLRSRLAQEHAALQIENQRASRDLAQEENQNKRRAMAISLLSGIENEADYDKQQQLYATLKPMAERYDTTLKLPDSYDPSLSRALSYSQLSPAQQVEMTKLAAGQTMTPYQQAQIDALTERNAIQREKMSAATTGKALTMPAMKDLEGKAKAYEDMTRLSSGFQDAYAGNALTGGLENVIGRIGGESAGLTDAGQTQWWQDYQTYLNAVRNDLFGAALTATEKAEFDKAMIGPRTDPAEARKNLARQQAIVQKALVRAGKVYQMGGFNAEQIGEYVPGGLEDIDTASPALDGGAPKPGTEEDGYVFLGGNPADPASWKKAR